MTGYELELGGGNVELYIISLFFFCLLFFFFNDTATTEIYTLSLHDALPISQSPLSFYKARTYVLWTDRKTLGLDLWKRALFLILRFYNSSSFAPI